MQDVWRKVACPIQNIRQLSFGNANCTGVSRQLHFRHIFAQDMELCIDAQGAREQPTISQSVESPLKSLEILLLTLR